MPGLKQGQSYMAPVVMLLLLLRWPDPRGRKAAAGGGWRLMGEKPALGGLQDLMMHLPQQQQP